MGDSLSFLGWCDMPRHNRTFLFCLDMTYTHLTHLYTLLISGVRYDIRMVQ